MKKEDMLLEVVIRCYEKEKKVFWELDEYDEN